MQKRAGGEVDIILDGHTIPRGVFHDDWVRRASPELLTQARAAIEALGGSKAFESFAGSLLDDGIGLEGYVGGGGWGEVFRAHYDSRTVAVKAFKPPYDQQWKRRIARETSALQGLSGNTGFVDLLLPPNEEHDLLFMVTSFVDGHTLNAEVPMAVEAAEQTICEILDLVAVMHGAGVLHRDLHLGNVMRGKDGIVMLDFGLARNLDDDAYTTFRPVGAMSHAAPEKWVAPSEAKETSDIFSVGVMLYRLLTGQHPFWAKTYISLYESIRLGAIP